MRRTTTALMAAAAALISAASASAGTVIDFEEYAFSGGGPYGANYYTKLVSQGFEFTNTLNSVSILATNHYATSDPGGAVLAIPFSGVTRVQRLDGKAFKLDSFDFADFTNSGSSPTPFRFTYFDGVKQSSRTLAYDASRGLQTADLNLNNLLWFSFETQGQFDNFRMSEVTAGVPEPATWALLILGFGGAGVQLRSRRRKLAAA